MCWKREIFLFFQVDAKRPESQVRFLPGVLFILEYLLVERVGILFFSYRCKETKSQVRFLPGVFFIHAETTTTMGGHGGQPLCGDFVRFNRIPSVVRPTSVTILLFAGRHRGLPLRKAYP